MSIERLRAELAAVDRELLELVAKRQALAARIGEEKRATGAATRDYAQEKVVLDRARGVARELGYSPELAAGILLSLIRSSLTVQEKGQVAARGTGAGRRALVVGGAGKMGGWFARFLASQGFDVETADPEGGDYEDWRDATLDHDLLVIATPMATGNEILLELAELRPRGLVFDLGSLKGPLSPGLTALRAAGVRVTSVHPMFGPDTELLSGRHVVFVDVGDAEATADVERLFESTMATRIRMDLESHDRVIAFVLGLSHALNIAFFTALAGSGEAAPRLAEVSSTTFDSQLDVARAVAGENARMYFEIQSLNAFGDEALSALVDAVAAVRDVVRSGDEAGFVELMARGRAYLSERDLESGGATPRKG